MTVLELEDIVERKTGDPYLDKLNAQYALLSPAMRIEQLYKDFKDSDVLLTSSFGTTSVLLLHLYHNVKDRTTVHFIDTKYHFRETLTYKKYLTELFNLHVIHVTPEDWKHQFTIEDKTWSKDPDFCCSVNKVEPLDKLKPQFKVWVSGLMYHQNEHRQRLNIFEKRDGILKFHPIIDIAFEDFLDYKQKHDLPEHPLADLGYDSIGCTHCTRKGMGRSGRWDGFSKTECGLHQ